MPKHKRDIPLGLLALLLVVIMAFAAFTCPPSECYKANAEEVKQEKCEAEYSVYFRGHCHAV